MQELPKNFKLGEEELPLKIFLICSVYINANICQMLSDIAVLMNVYIFDLDITDTSMR
jgi:hypothetical protein